MYNNHHRYCYYCIYCHDCYQQECYLVLLPEGMASLLQLGSLGQQVVLLQAYHRARAAHPNVANGLLRGEVVVLDEVAADEHPRPPQTRLAVDSQSACTQYGF